MNPLKSLKAAFWLVLISTILCISLIAILDITLIIVILIIVPWLATVIIYIMAYLDNTPSEPIESIAPIPSKGTSNANRLGETRFEADPNSSTKVGITGIAEVVEAVKDSKMIEIEGKLLVYDEPVRFPPRELDRMLTDDELRVMEKHYHGFYHAIGVSLEGEIPVTPRANSRDTTHYTTPEILAEYILDLDEEE